MIPAIPHIEKSAAAGPAHFQKFHIDQEREPKRLHEVISESGSAVK